MAQLGSIVGSGRIEGNVGEWRPTSIVDEAQIEPVFGVQIGFYSPSGEYVGTVQSSPDGAGFINFEIVEERNGGLDSFEFEIGRKIDIPFYPLLECRFFISGVHWYTGELIFQPVQDKRDPTYMYEGNGYAEYLKRIKIDTTYSNKTMSFILKDMLFNYIVTNSRIIYNEDLIHPPDITITKFEIKKKDAFKTIERLLEIANFDYNTNQYVFGVDVNRQFYFRKVEKDIEKGFFEGFQYQNPKTKEDFKKVINQIIIYRTKEGTQTTELVTTLNDNDSQAKYGLKSKNLTIPVFVDNNSAIKIGNSILERNREPFSTVSVESLETEKSPYPIKFYHLNNKVNNYNKIIAEFELLTAWSFNIKNTIISTTEDKVLSGRRSFKCVINNGSAGESIEKEFEEEVNFPDTLEVWLAQMSAGKYIMIELYDDEGNVQRKELSVLIINDYNKVSINVGLRNIKKVRIEFVSNEENTIYLDRLEVKTRSFFRRELILDKIKYKLDRSKLLANCTFGDKTDTLLDKIKNIKKENDNIFDVLEKN